VLSQGTQHIPPEEMVNEWNFSIMRLYDKIESFFLEYVEQKILSIFRETDFLSEELLGEYAIEELNLTSGPERITFTPRAQIVAGATGRIDVYNKRQPNTGFMLLRRNIGDKERWTINSRTTLNHFTARFVPSPLSKPGPVEMTEDFNRENIEQMIDSLLPQ